MDMDVYCNYQAQQRYAFLHSFTEYCFSSNVYLKRIEFKLNVNLLNFHHFKSSDGEEPEQLRKIATDKGPTESRKSKIKDKMGKLGIGIMK